MKWKALLIAAVLLTAAVVTPAHALDYAFDEIGRASCRERV